MKILWAICVVFGAIGFVQGIVGVFGAVSAPQQAAGAAMGVAWAVLHCPGHTADAAARSGD